MDPGVPGERYQVVVHVDAAVLANANAPGQAVLEGARISAETSQRLACDASRVVMRHDADGDITEAGARMRTTRLSNLITLCRRHHRAVHEDGFQLTRKANGELIFRTPHGRPLPAVPPQPAAPAAPAATLREQNEARGVHIDAYTSTPSWLGERLDLGYTISVLHPLACRPSAMA